MHLRLHALTLDLDDTLWPIWPAIERAERALHDWLVAHSPQTARRWSIGAMRELRQHVLREHPELAHDPSAQRRRSLQIAMAHASHDLSLIDAAYDVFYVARNQVDLYPDVPEALGRLSRRRPLAAVTNGNADLRRIGLDRHFVFNLSARDHGVAKPSVCIFQAACARLAAEPERVLHVGDDPDTDIRGAQGAGMATCWINRDGRRWPYPDHLPTLQCRTLTTLADWLEQLPNPRTEPA